MKSSPSFWSVFDFATKEQQLAELDKLIERSNAQVAERRRRDDDDDDDRKWQGKYPYPPKKKKISSVLGDILDFG